jgi:glycosyltransferase involved in cell wall biosynthesis
MFLSIIIPAYNEEKTLANIIDKLMSVKMPEFVQQIEYLIIDDCSSDSTSEIGKKLSESYKEVSYYRHEINQGKGGAVHSGYAAAKGDTLLIQDADLELSPNDIPFLLNAMHDLDIMLVNGSRYLPGPVRPAFAYSRYFFNQMFTVFTSVLLNVKLTDMACGYKLIKKELLNQITLKEKRFGFECELLIKALRLKKTGIAEVPVHYYPRNEGQGKKLKNTDGIRIFWCILKYGLFRMK